MAAGKTIIVLLIAAVICCCCFSIVACGGLFLMSQTGSPAALSFPVSTLPSGYVKLINTETTFNNTNMNTPVVTQPTAAGGASFSYNLQPVQFTVSFKVNSTGTQPIIPRTILANSPSTSHPGNAPSFTIVSTNLTNTPPDVDKVVFIFTGSDGIIYTANTSSALVANQYHTITGVADTNKITIYFDGANPVETTLPTGQTLRYENGDSDNQNNKFVWNNLAGTVPFKIKDAYWWPRALTAAEVASLA